MQCLLFWKLYDIINKNWHSLNVNLNCAVENIENIENIENMVMWHADPYLYADKDGINERGK